MAGLDLGSRVGGRRATNQEVPLIPFIDFMLCLVAFLLVTAVWSQMARVKADAQVPGSPDSNPVAEPEKRLHVDMRGDRKFQLMWKQGNTVVSTLDIDKARDPVGDHGEYRYSELAQRIAEEWKMHGAHRALTDPVLDQAVLHTDNSTPFSDVIAVMDAIHAPKRDATIAGETQPVSTFNLSFAVN